MSDLRTEKLIDEYLGKKFMTKDGLEEIEIIAVRSYGDVDIRFNPSGVIKNTKIGNIKMGLSSPFFNPKTKQISPICFDTPQHEFEGQIFNTNDGSVLTITKYVNYNEVHYQFLDQFKYSGATTLQNIRKGQVRNPYAPNELGGYLGEEVVYRTNEYGWLQNIWYQILTRISGKREDYAKTAKAYLNVAAYRDIKFDPSWYCYSSFANWYMINFEPLNKCTEYQVDKDLLYPYYSTLTQGKKCYSPSTCVLLPKEINIGIAQFNRCSQKNLPEFIKNFSAVVQNAYENKMIDQDTYCVLKRFYLKDPNYSDYLTNKYNNMRISLCAF